MAAPDLIIATVFLCPLGTVPARCAIETAIDGPKSSVEIRFGRISPAPWGLRARCADNRRGILVCQWQGICSQRSSVSERRVNGALPSRFIRWS